MADFCKTYDPELCDLEGLCKPSEAVLILCEGCGEQHFINHEGYRVSREAATRGVASRRKESDHG